MKTTSITVERNFHIMNDDRFIMEKISMTAEVDVDEREDYVADKLREMIINNFKAAYPKVYTHLNFDETIQVNPEYAHHLGKLPSISNEQFTNIMNHADTANAKTRLYENTTENVTWVTHPNNIPIEKIQKGTIEEQIEAYTDADKLKEDWYNTVKGSKKYKAVYDAQMDKLTKAVIGL